MPGDVTTIADLGLPARVTRVLDANGPRVAFVYGVAGIGKTALLNAFASEVQGSGAQVWRIDCAAIDPTESSFRAALDAAGWRPGSAGVVLVDTYELFRIADPWLRHELVPSLSTELRFVIAGRDAPMLEWSTQRGRLGGLEILPLVGLSDEAARAFLAEADVADDHADMICRIARGHPLSLRLAAEAEVAHLPMDEIGPRVVAALATAFRAGLDEEGRRLLDAASVPRRVTRGVLEAMAYQDADDALERLGALSFVDETSEGLRLHDAVQAGAGRLALEVAVAEAIAAFSTIRGAKCEYLRPVRRAIELLRERLDDEVTLDALADHADTDKFHLCRAFRTQVGLPPHAYLTRLRIMRAKELLAPQPGHAPSRS